MNIKPIKRETDYGGALARVDKLMDAEPDTPQEDELDILLILIEKYDVQNYPVYAPNPVDAIRLRMD